MSEPYQYVVKLSRGTEKDDRDEQKVKVTAETIEELDQRVERVKSKLQGWADDFREIQPQEGRSIDEDQTELEGVRA